MLRHALAFACCLITGIVQAAPALQRATSADSVRTRNISLAFDAFYVANKDKPELEQLVLFKQQVASSFPAFYGIARYRDRTQLQQDDLILHAIRHYPTIRDDYLLKARQFDTELPRYVASFKAWFPDFQPTADIVVLHSLGEMDGGTRTFDGRNYLIFGIDGMVRYHGKGNETAFFHHELFHVHHEKAMADCAGDEDPMWGMWAYLWQEGLATYVSKAMNPDASEQELLLTLPDDMAARTRKALPAALADLEAVLDRRDADLAGRLFSTSGKDADLPPRRGYYLGYLVAQEAAKRYSVQALAKLDCRQSRELVVATVKQLRVAHPQ